MNNAKKLTFFTFIGISAILLSISGVAYSWVNNNNDESYSNSVVKQEELSVVFTGKQLIKADYLKNKESVKKEFTVKNTSSGAINYDIVFTYINNEYVDKDGLMYNLKDQNGKVILMDTVMPVTGANIPILKNVTLEKNEKLTYILEIKYIEKMKDKKAAQTFEAKIGVENNTLE